MSLEIKYHREGDVHIIETGNAALGTIRIDQTGIPQEERAGTAKQLLAASALYCYCAALDSALKARGAEYSTIDAVATIEAGKNARGLSRVNGIALKTKVKLDESDSAVFERCEKVMSYGCLVTSSLHDGIEVTYCLESDFED